MGSWKKKTKEVFTTQFGKLQMAMMSSRATNGETYMWLIEIKKKGENRKPKGFLQEVEKPRL